MTKQKILLIDDSTNNIKLLFNMLGDIYEISFSTDGHKGLVLAQENLPDLILLDIVMPEINGFEVCEQLKGNSDTRHIPIIFLTAETDVEMLVKGFEIGIVDYVTKPFNSAELLARVTTQMSLQSHQKELKSHQKELQQKNTKLVELNKQLSNEIKHRNKVEIALYEADKKLSAITDKETKRWRLEAFVGKSPLFLQLIDQIRKVQEVDHTSVLILGESGTGKELVARAIHYGSSRSKEAFITVNCSAIPTELAESAFFGHIKGSFTGANDNRKGFFEAADGGTLFLDELGDMPLLLQTKLLRVLEDKKITRVGSHTEKKINVRIIAATNSHLEQAILDKTFRQDFYYRLTGFTIKLPPLKNRSEDIPVLIEHFLRTLSEEMNFSKAQISQEALSQLGYYSFPGNIRELRNIVEHALISCNGQMIQLKDLNLIQSKNDETSIATEDLINSNFIDSTNNGTKLQSESNVLSTVSPQPLTNTIPDLTNFGINNNEKIVLDYLELYKKINNIQCQKLLGINNNQSTYLFKKMKASGQLIATGERRWVYYQLAQ